MRGERGNGGRWTLDGLAYKHIIVAPAHLEIGGSPFLNYRAYRLSALESRPLTSFKRNVAVSARGRPDERGESARRPRWASLVKPVLEAEIPQGTVYWR